jgi:hypothetical protein
VSVWQEWCKTDQECQVCAARGTLELVEGSSVLPQLRHLSSAKLEYLRHLALETRQQGEQLLIFSLWTATLDLLEPVLANESVPFCRWGLGCLHQASIVEGPWLCECYKSTWEENGSLFFTRKHLGGKPHITTAACCSFMLVWYSAALPRISAEGPSLNRAACENSYLFKRRGPAEFIFQGVNSVVLSARVGDRWMSCWAVAGWTEE